MPRTPLPPLITLLTITLALTSLPASASGSHSRKAHIRRDGVLVAPSRATNPDRSRINNYSHQGNINPYSGKRGRKK